MNKKTNNRTAMKTPQKENCGFLFAVSVHLFYSMLKFLRLSSQKTNDYPDTRSLCTIEHTFWTLIKRVAILATLFFVFSPAPAEASIQFVGSTTANGTNAVYSMSLTSLTGGIASAPAQDDIVIVVNAFHAITDGNPDAGTTTGFTEIADLYSNDNYDANVSVNYKVMTASPDTSVLCAGSIGSASSSVCTAMVFRGVSTTNPMDIASTTATGINAEDVNCPSITPVTPGAYVVCAGGAAGISIDTAIATIAGYTLAYRQQDAGGAAAAVMAYKAWTSGAEDPAAFAMDLGTASQNSWAGVTMALRPYLPPITISGTLYTDEGATPLTGSTKTIGLAVGTSTRSLHSTTTNSGTGAFSFSLTNDGRISASTPIVMWVDNASEKAVVFTKATTTDTSITDLDLYQDRAIIRHEGTSTTTRTVDMAFYDGDDDSDIQYTANSGALSVRAGNELHIWTGDTFAPTSTVTINGNAGSGVDGSLHLPASAVYTAGGTTTLAGSFTASSSASFNPTTTPLVFNATTTGKSIDYATTSSLGTTTFNGSGGGWTFGTTSTSSVFTITAGSVTLPSGGLTVTGNFSNAGTYTPGSATTTFLSASAQTIAGTLTGAGALGNTAFLGAGSKTFSNNASTSNLFIGSGTTVAAPSSGLLFISGAYNNQGTFTSNAATTSFNGASAQSIMGNLTGANTLGNVLFQGAGTKVFSSNASTTNLFIDSTSGAVTAPTLLFILGSYTNDSTFTPGTGTTTFSGSTNQRATGTLSFYNLELTNSAASTTFSAPLSVTNFFKASTTGLKIEFAGNATSTLASARFLGTSGNEVKLRSATPGTKAGLSITGSYSVAYTDVKDSSGTTTSGAISATDSSNINSGNNNGWTFSLTTITGYLYSDEGNTVIQAIKNINVVVGTSTPGTVYATSTRGTTGAWGINLDDSHGIVASTPIIVYVDGDAATRAVLVTKAAAAGSISNLPLYQNRVIVKHEATSGTSTTLTDMNNYDGGDDSDIQYSTDGSTLTVNAGNELYIYAGTTFAPGTTTIRGNASSSTYDGSLRVLGTFAPSGTTTLAGNLYASSTSSFNVGSNVVVFNATTTGKYITQFSTSSLGALLFNSTSGSWKFMSDHATTSSFTIAYGTVTPPIGNLTVEGHLTNNSELNYSRGGMLIASSTAAQTISGNLTATSALASVILRGGSTKTFSSSASTSNLTIETGNTMSAPAALSVTRLFNNQGTFTNNSGTIYLAGASTTLVGNFSGSSNALYSIVASGTPRFAGGDASTTISTLGMVTDVSTDDKARAVWSDAHTIYVAGECSTGCSIGAYDYYVVAYDKQTGAVRWATSTDGSTGWDQANGMVGDSTSLYVTGHCGGCGNRGNFAYYTVAYDKQTGAVRWSTSTDPTANDDDAYDVWVDDENVYVTGYCDGCGSVGGWAIYTIAYRKTDAAFVWASTTDPTSGNWEFGNGIWGDQDTVYVAGSCLGCSGASDAAFYILAFDKRTGASRWNKMKDFGFTDRPLDIWGDQDTVYAAGFCQTQCPSDINGSFTLVALNKFTGAERWSTTTDAGTGESWASGISGDRDWLYLAGHCDACGSGGTDAVYTMAIDRLTGSVQRWATTTDPTPGSDLGYDVWTDEDYVYVTGECASCGNQNDAIVLLKFDKRDASLIHGNNTLRFASAASTTNITVGGTGTTSTNTLYAPTNLTIAGNFTQNDQFIAGAGTTTFLGTTPQTATGTLVFNNVSVENSSASTTFSASTTVTGHFKATTAGAKIEFPANATTTLNTVNVLGTSGNEVKLRSTTAGTKAGLRVTGSYAFTYADVKDSSATNTAGLLTQTTSINSGNNNGWDFPAAGDPTLTSDANQTFAQNQATTTISTITVTDHVNPGITATNDLRIRIASTTVRMLWDSADTSVTLGGTASGKVSDTVSYEGAGSILVLDVTSDFSSSDTLTISGLSFSQFSAMNSAATALTVYTGGSEDTIADATDDKTVTITGSLTIGTHDAGQTTDAFSGQEDTGVVLLRAKLTPSGEDFTVSSLVFNLVGIRGIESTDLTNLKLYRDLNSDGAYNAGTDTQIGGAGTPSISDQTGTITFSSSFAATTTLNYILIGDYANVRPGEQMTLQLKTTGFTATGDTTGGVLNPSGTTESQQHSRKGGGSTSGGYSLGPIGGEAPTSTPIGGGSTGTPESGGEVGGGAPTTTTPEGGGGGGGGGMIFIPGSKYFAGLPTWYLTQLSRNRLVEEGTPAVAGASLSLTHIEEQINEIHVYLHRYFSVKIADLEYNNSEALTPRETK